MAEEDMDLKKVRLELSEARWYANEICEKVGTTGVNDYLRMKYLCNELMLRLTKLDTALDFNDIEDV